MLLALGSWLLAQILHSELNIGILQFIYNIYKTHKSQITSNVH